MRVKMVWKYVMCYYVNFYTLIDSENFERDITGVDIHYWLRYLNSGYE